MLKSKPFGIIKNVAFVGLGILILILVFRNVDIDVVFAQILAANFFWIIFSRVFTVSAHILRAARWRMMAEPLGYKVRVMNSFYAVMIGYITNLGIPRLGEIMRAWSLQRTDKVPVVSSLGTVVVERVIDVLIMTLLLLLVLVLKYSLLYEFFMQEMFLPFVDRLSANVNTIILMIIVGMAALMIIWVLFKQNFVGNRLKQVVKNFTEGLSTISKVKNLPLFICYSVLIWVLYLVATYVTFFAFKATAELGFINALMVFTFSSLSMMVPVQGGIGAFHYLATMVLLLLGIPKEEGLAFATIIHAVSMVVFIILGSWSYLMVMIKLKK